MNSLDFVGGLFGLGSKRVARLLAEKLEQTIGRPKRVLAVGDGLGRALSAAGLPVMSIGRPGGRRRQGMLQMASSLTSLPLEAGSLDAVCMVGIPSEGLPALRECARVVRQGGLLAMIAASPALMQRSSSRETMAAIMLHASLVEIEQRQLGSTWITLGRVHLWT